MANVDIRLGHKNTAWFSANTTLVLKDGQMVVCSDGANKGKYKIGDGTTQLSVLTFYGGTSVLPAWGSITGTLSSQTDLQTALNAKQNTITTGTTAQYLRGDLSLATFPTNVSSFSNDSGYITSSALTPYLTIASAASTYQPIGTYATASNSMSFTNKSGNISQWINDSGYVSANTFSLQLSHAPNSSAFAANNIRYWSNIFFDTSAPRATAGQQLIRLPFNATVKSAVITTWNASGGVSQTNSTVFLRINGIDQALSSAVLWSSSAATTVNNQITGLNIPITTSDSFEIKIQMGNLVTAPSASAVCSVTLYLDK